MAGLDAEVSHFCWKFLFPVLIGIACIKLIKLPLRFVYKRSYAYVVHVISLRFNKKLGWRKEKLFSNIASLTHGKKRNHRVLEIGVGSGSNFKYYPSNTDVICLDPNPHFQSYLENRNEFENVNLKKFVVGYAEDMSEIPQDSVDAVVCTLVLCSVKDMNSCMKEIMRVLRPVRMLFRLFLKVHLRFLEQQALILDTKITSLFLVYL